VDTAIQQRLVSTKKPTTPSSIDASLTPIEELSSGDIVEADILSLAQVVERIASEWEEETQFLSDLDARYAHPAYQRVIDIGWTAVPVLLARMKKRPDFWFQALRAITGADPVSRANAGRLTAMAKEWIEWGRTNRVTV
jgi:hypothetical protein